MYTRMVEISFIKMTKKKPLANPISMKQEISRILAAKYFVHLVSKEKGVWHVTKNRRE